jgi:uncharacterized Zn finger protein
MKKGEFIHMTTLSCNKCGSIDLFVKSKGSQIGLYCTDCGAWIKWVGKEEQRLVELQIERLKKISIPEVKPPKDSYLDLSNISTDDLLEELRRRIIE